MASANDIIEYDGARWRVVFDSVNQGGDVQYVTNIVTGIQYKWIPPTVGTAEPGQWVKSYDGLYAGGSWNLML